MANIAPVQRTLEYKTVRDSKLPYGFNDLLITKVLNEGTYGVAYAALRQPMKEWKVVKFAKVKAKDDQIKERRMGEFLRQQPLSSFIAYLQEVIPSQDPEAFALVYNYEGKDLMDVISKRDNLPSHLIKHLGWQIFQGLEHLHKYKVVHGDLKLENVVINDKWQAKIIDFGHARFRGDPIEQATGTHGYLSPEVLISPRDADSTSDYVSAVILLGFLYLSLIEERWLLMRMDDQESIGINIVKTFEEMVYQMDDHPTADDIQKAQMQSMVLLKPNPDKPKGYDFAFSFPGHKHIEKWQARMEKGGKLRKDSPEDIALWIELFSAILKFQSKRASVEKIMQLAEKFLAPPPQKIVLADARDRVNQHQSPVKRKGSSSVDQQAAKENKLLKVV